MALPKEVSERRMLPQWLTPAQAAKTGERVFGQSPRRLSSRDEWWLQELKRKFENNSNFYTAADLHFSAVMAGRPEFAAAASRVYASSKIGQRVSTQLRTSASTAPPLLHTEQVVREQIANIKRILADEGRQPLQWAELARNYVLIGQTEQAIRCMRIALQLAGPHRYLYRTACRLFVHADMDDEAVELVRRHPGLSADPWLLSCEIAATTVTGKTSKNIGRARKLLESGSIAPAHATELAAAIASIEHEAGAVKRAKKWYAMGAVQPTANTLAQIEWAHQKDPQIGSILSSQPLHVNAGEALAWRARHDRQWESVVAYCQEWLRIEPYSSRPALLGSFYVELTGKADFTLMESISSAGLLANPRNPSLLNNRAVGRAYTGQLKGALQDVVSAIEQIAHLTSAEDDGCSVPFLRATLGLIAYRSGHASLGESFYAQSLSQFLEEKDRPSFLLAALHWCREEARLGAPDVSRTLELIRKRIKVLPTTQAPELQSMLELVSNEVKQKSLEISLSASDPIESSALYETDQRLQALEGKKETQSAVKYSPRRALESLIQQSD